VLGGCDGLLRMLPRTLVHILECDAPPDAAAVAAVPEVLKGSDALCREDLSFQSGSCWRLVNQHTCSWNGYGVVAAGPMARACAFGCDRNVWTILFGCTLGLVVGTRA